MTGSARPNRLVLRFIVGAMAIGAVGLTAPLAAADGLDGNPKFETNQTESSNPLHRKSFVAIPGRAFTEAKMSSPTVHQPEKEAPSATPRPPEMEAPTPHEVEPDRAPDAPE